jgi:hypothetical protein
MQYKSALNPDGNFNGQFSVFHKYANNVTNSINMDVIHSAEGELLNSRYGPIINVSDRLLNDPYLVTRAMPDEFAVKNLVNRFSKIYNHSDKNLNLHFHKYKDTLNEGGHYKLETNSMYVSLSSDLSSNINTVSHELRHKKQYEYADKFWKQLWYKLSGNNKYNKREFMLSSYFKWQNIKYDVLPQNNLSNENSILYKLYRNNGLETDAYKNGFRYEKDYIARSEEFKKHFPYISVYNRGTIGSGHSA